MKISIIIPTWNQWQATLACLKSVKAYSGEAKSLGCELEVIVVGCGANEATTKEFMPLGTGLFGQNFTHLRLPINTSFAAACNQGAAYATGQVLFFLSCMAELTEGWLTPLMTRICDGNEHGIHPKMGALAPLTVYKEDGIAGNTGRVHHCGIAFTPSLQPQNIYAQFPEDHPAVHAKHDVQALSGIALMVTIAAFKQCGGFHQGYEGTNPNPADIELCCRLRDNGFTLHMVTESRVLFTEEMRVTKAQKDQDATNANMLTTRCSGAFRPDMHTMALHDGFAVALTPWLGIYITMAPEQDAALTEQNLDVFDMAICWETLNREPLWQGGYQIMCAMLEDAHMFAQSTGLRLLQTAFFPAMPHYRLLAQTAAQAGHDDLAQKAHAEVERLGHMLEDIDFLINKARKLAQWGHQAGDAVIESLYIGWLTDLGLSVE
ncbi:MAG: glycosyltransferase [Pseudomonadota bacterium]